MSRDKPLNHPRDLFTPEQQAQMDRELRNMNAARDVPLGRGEEIRLVYVNADAECDEALRTTEVAYAELLERYEVLAAIVRDLADKEDIWHYGEAIACPHCHITVDRMADVVDVLEDDSNHAPGCSWGRARVFVKGQDNG